MIAATHESFDDNVARASHVVKRTYTAAISTTQLLRSKLAAAGLH